MVKLKFVSNPLVTLHWMMETVPKKATKPREEWTYINLPKELGEAIDNLVDQRKHGYRSRSDFVADAVRRLLHELKPLK